MDQIGHYKIIGKIGEGGMGEVYKGLDTMLEREVAIKLMRPELINRQEIVDRFKSEAVATGRMNHSNITTLYNFGQINNQYYMALEFVSGETLENILKKHGALPWRDAVNYTVAMLAGLAYAHQLGIVHRDLKPTNIMVNDQGTVKIMDFGIARILGKARLTRTGNFIGTLEYTPPEQIQGKEGDARSDIYSLGAVLYEMLTGQVLFTGTTEFDLMNAQIREKPRPPRKLNADIPAELEKIVLQAVEKDPAKRFSSAAEFSQALQKLLQRTESKPHASGFLMNLWRHYPAVVVAVAVLAPGAGFVLWTMNTGEPVTPSIPVAVPLQQSTPAQIAEYPVPAVAEHEISTAIDPQPMPVLSGERFPQLASIPGNDHLQPLPTDLSVLEKPFNPFDEAEPIGFVDDDLGFITPRTGLIPIPARKPESIKSMQPVRTAVQAQPGKSAPEPVRAEEHRAAPRQTPSAAAAPAQDEQDIGEWAKDFFGEN